eukprot:Nk52_evm25s311 gene=Nk52_evmTU25s311
MVEFDPNNVSEPSTTVCAEVESATSGKEETSSAPLDKSPCANETLNLCNGDIANMNVLSSAEDQNEKDDAPADGNGEAKMGTPVGNFTGKDLCVGETSISREIEGEIVGKATLADVGMDNTGDVEASAEKGKECERIAAVQPPDLEKEPNLQEFEAASTKEASLQPTEDKCEMSSSPSEGNTDNTTEKESFEKAEERGKSMEAEDNERAEISLEEANDSHVELAREASVEATNVTVEETNEVPVEETIEMPAMATNEIAANDTFPVPDVCKKDINAQDKNIESCTMFTEEEALQEPQNLTNGFQETTMTEKTSNDDGVNGGAPNTDNGTGAPTAISTNVTGENPNARPIYVDNNDDDKFTDDEYMEFIDEEAMMKMTEQAERQLDNQENMDMDFGEEGGFANAAADEDDIEKNKVENDDPREESAGAVVINDDVVVLREVPAAFEDNRATFQIVEGFQEKMTGEEKKERKKHGVRGAIGFEDLLSKHGLPYVKDRFPRTKFKGRGHENADLTKLIGLYKEWLHRLNPRVKFNDALLEIERNGSKGAVKRYLDSLRFKDENLMQNITAADVDEAEKQQNETGNQPPPDTPTAFETDVVVHDEPMEDMEFVAPSPEPYEGDDSLRMEAEREMELEMFQ